LQGTTTLYRPAAHQRLSSWLFLPLIALALLFYWLAVPAADLRLPASPEDLAGNAIHFWIVAAAGALAILVGGLMYNAARKRSDARVLLIAMTLLTAAAAMLLHALATPNVLVSGRNIGFVIAAPVGLVIASLFAAASAIDYNASQSRMIVSRQAWFGGGLVLFWAAFGAMALLKLPPFSLVPDLEEFNTPLMFCFIGQTPAPLLQFSTSIALFGATGLYGWSSWRYATMLRRQPSVVLVILTLAFILLTITALNIGLGRTWRLTWWEWHIIVALAGALLALGVFRQFRSEGSAEPIFDSLYLDETIQRIRGEYAGALERMVENISRRAEQPEGSADEPSLVPAVAQQFGLSEGQARVLERAAEALASEREQITRLGALVAVGQQTSVITEERLLLQQALSLTSAAFGRDQLQIGLIQEGKLDLPAELRGGPLLHVPPDERAKLLGQALRERQPIEQGSTFALPLLVKGRAAGVLEVRRARGSFAERDRALLSSLAAQLSIALENARLYRQIDQLFRQYMPSSVATALLADPSQAALGGAVREISVMFGDLRGFTTVSERLSPPELVDLLNRYYGAASPMVLDQGGTIDKFMGDAMMALFNAPSTQPDHALRACRAALAMQRVITPITAEAPDMPRFGIGVNTGPALVGNIGSESIRNFTAIGDTVNLASRLQTRANGGQVLISGSTYAQVKEYAEVQPLGSIQVKGREEPVDAFVLVSVRD
jgi:class 3 adenylate cyclase